MTISIFTRYRRVALPPRLGAILALTALVSLGAGARDARALVAITTYADFAFKFDASLPGGTLSGSGVLEAERTYTDPVGQWTVYDVTGGSVTATPTGGIARTYTLAYAPPGAFPTSPGNDNLLFPLAYPQLDNSGLTFTVQFRSITVGYLNITDPNGGYNFNIGGRTENTTSGSGTFQAPSPTPGTGLLAFAFLMLAGTATRARELLAR